MEYKTYSIPFTPTANPAAIIQKGEARFTVLTDRIIRMEYDPGRTFEDRPSQAIWYRQQPVPQFSKNISEKQIEILTDYLRLTYLITEAGFTQQTLTVELLQTGKIWHFGDRDYENLRGTGRTLDEADGAIHLDTGLMSRSGWAVLDDSQSLVFDHTGWIAARPGVTGESPESIDQYFFGYGHEYLACLKDYAKLSGKVPMLPRWVLGNWWSRYWEFSAVELKDLMTTFEANDIPLSVCIIDMDWHITKTGNFSSGWTGYTWNRELFPDPQGFLAWLHEKGLKTALNLHPADGVHPHEADYPAMAAAMGIDPESKAPVPFDIADPHFTKQYFDILHHPKEKEGIDFWWMDWQQGVRIKNSKHPVAKYLDPLFWLNHLHFYDLQRDGSSRGFIFSRWGGMGNHRYPIGFSGDSVVSWKSLAFQPYFTATASNVAYSWWSHDIGGHMAGIETPELYTRWVQYGVFSPIFRLHCTKNPYQNRTPWGYDKDTLDITRKYMQLRHQLIPYIYTMSWRNYAEDKPLISPMYYLHPEEEAAYHLPNQYYFGSQLMAAPFTSPRDPHTNLSSQTVWLPSGTWYHFFTGEAYQGNRFVTLHGDMTSTPVFAPAGAIIPLDAEQGWGSGLQNPSKLEVLVFAGKDNQFELYEDDNTSYDYANNEHCATLFIQSFTENQLTFTISTPQGGTKYLPDQREFCVKFYGVSNPSSISVLVDDRPVAYTSDYSAENELLTITGIQLSTAIGESCQIVLSAPVIISQRDRRAENIRSFLRKASIDSWQKAAIDQTIPRLLEQPDVINVFAHQLSPSQLKAIKDIISQ